MEADQWISVGSLAVAGLAIYVGPRVSGRVAREQHIAQSRTDIYAEAIDLMRARLFEVEDEAKPSALLVEPTAGPTDQEGDATAARLLLVATEPVWKLFSEFFQLYQGTSAARAFVEQGRKGGGPNPTAQASLAQAAKSMKQRLDDVIDQMAKDVGTRRKPIKT
jgi:hypothetical protein